MMNKFDEVFNQIMTETYTSMSSNKDEEEKTDAVMDTAKKLAAGNDDVKNATDELADEVEDAISDRKKQVQQAAKSAIGNWSIFETYRLLSKLSTSWKNNSMLLLMFGVLPVSKIYTEMLWTLIVGTECTPMTIKNIPI